MKAKNILLAHGIIVAVAIAIIVIVIFAGKDTVIINHGMTHYRRGCTYLITIGVLLSISWAIDAIALFLNAWIKRDSKYNGQSRVSTERGRKSILRELGKRKEKWPSYDVTKYIIECESIICSLDAYEYNLLELLKVNPSDDIGGSTDMLEHIEDSMFINLYRFNNYLISMSASEQEFVASKGKECCDKNKALLEYAKGFVASVTDYINRGVSDNEEALQLVQSYQLSILDAMGSDDIYLT